MPINPYSISDTEEVPDSYSQGDGFLSNRSNGRDVSLEKIYEPIQKELDRVDKDLRSLSLREEGFLSELLNHVLDNEGKLIRPAITLLSSRFYPNDGRGAENMAAAVELLHVATLIHDDTVDDSDLRRGKVTVSTRWGLNTAVLLGDFLLAKSSTRVCETGNLRAIRRFSDVAVELSAGELNEVNEAYSPMQSRLQYMNRIRKKTAALFSIAAETGAVLSGAPDPTIESLKNYGDNLGIAFQIVDDILDFDGTREEVGKPVGSDLRHGIVTLPAILAMERYPKDNPLKDLYGDYVEGHSPKRLVDEVKLLEVIDLVQTTSVLEDSYKVAEQFCANALGCLDTLHHDASRNSLQMLAGYMVYRRS